MGRDKNKLVKDSSHCLIIAEVSANHGQNFNRAVALIKKATQCGADAVKFQAYTPDTLTINADNKYFQIKHPEWGGQTLYELYKKAYTPWNWFKKLKSIADDLGIIFFSTAFDKTAVDLLEEIDVPIHKIASFELVDLPLVEYVAKTKGNRRSS
jgi:sialic acid synthase SpsE